MDYRRLIKFGNSSYVVSVPKDWLRKNHLEKGDMVYVSENGSNELVIVPNLPQHEPELKEITIHVNGKTMKEVKRELISSYLNDYSVVILEGDEMEKNAREIRDLVHNIMALEIIEQTKDKIVTKDFLNMREISLPDLLRKMDIITRSMIGDLVLCVDKNMSTNIEQREDDVNRMAFVLLRVTRRGLKDPEYLKTLKLTSFQLFELWHVGSQVEQVADQVREIALTCPHTLSPDQKEFAKKMLRQIEVLYLDVMKAFYTKDYALANRVSIMKNEIIDVCKEDVSYVVSGKRLHDHSPYIRFLERLIILSKEVNKIARRVYS